MKRMVIHYGELSTKGRNRKIFQNKLADHIRYKAKVLLEPVKVHALHDFMHVEWEKAPYEDMVAILKNIPGIARFESSYQVPKDIQAISNKAIELFSTIDIQAGDSFKVVARRSDKTFEYDSYDIQRIVGGLIDDTFDKLSVELKKPTHKLTISIHQDEAAYLSLDSYPGLQGLPYGTSGKGMLLLSGGFDSPIAAYLMMKRGMEIEMIHFASPPYTSPQALDKVRKLTAHLSKYGMPLKLHIVPFTRIQEEIRDHVHNNESMTVMRRMMLRIAERIMIERKGQAIINGESLGQVASQTLTSMSVINEVTHTPILRPLIATDKNDIIYLAEQIGTYEVSNEPFEDCCTVFAPSSPHTKPKLDVIKELEEKLDIEALIQEAIDQTNLETIDESYLNEQQSKFDSLL